MRGLSPCPSNKLGQQLLEQALQEFVCKNLYLTSPQRSAIRNILQFNLASGRLHRYYERHLAEEVEGFLAAYVSLVAGYYLEENPVLLLLQAGDVDAWLRLSDWLTRCAHVKLRQVKATNSLPDRHSGDFAQEISLWLVDRFSKTNWISHNEGYCSPVGQAIGYTYDVPFSNWIAKVQSRRIIDQLRRSMRHGSTSMDLAEWAAAEDILEHTVECAVVEQEISRLTQHQQQVMGLYSKGLETWEVAERLGCTNRAVYNCKHAAVRRLRHELNP